jgi:hypothetical protein
VKPTAQEEAEERVAPEAATYQGAAANGREVFFTTRQQLLGSDTDETTDLYEYDFHKPGEAGKHLPAGAVGEHLVQLSAGECAKNKSGELVTTCGSGAEVQGVVRTASDGSHVYFVAKGVLTDMSNGNEVDEEGKRELEHAKPGRDNLYALDTETGQTKFVAELSERDHALWGIGPGVVATECQGEGSKSAAELSCDAISREAQTTPDGRYLVFSTYAHLNKADANPGQAVYRYSFEGGPEKEGELTWVSHGAPGFKEYCEEQPNAEGKEKSAGEKEHCEKEGQNAVITPLNGSTLGAAAGGADWGRAISSNEEGTHDGEYVVFTTSEKLQADDVNREPDVYLWHCSAVCPHPAAESSVAMISDGRDPEGVDLTPAGEPGSPGMSASGSDIFFTTHTRLVGQDTDELGDLYDARVGGGFPRPPAAFSCAEEGGREATCQEDSQLQRELRAEVFGPLASLLPGPGGNLVSSPPGSSSPAHLGPSVSLTAVRLKGTRLLVTVRISDEGTVTVSGRGLKRTSKVFAGGTHRLEVPLNRAGRRMERAHGKTELEATLKVGKTTASKALAVRL